MLCPCPSTLAINVGQSSPGSSSRLTSAQSTRAARKFASPTRTLISPLAPHPDSQIACLTQLETSVPIARVRGAVTSVGRTNELAACEWSAPTGDSQDKLNNLNKSTNPNSNPPTLCSTALGPRRRWSLNPLFTNNSTKSTENNNNNNNSNEISKLIQEPSCSLLVCQKTVGPL